MRPKISVCTITYGQEKFISQCLEGVLNQVGDFDLEFIIGNDNSPDNSAEIIENYINSHPKGKCIKFLNRKENIGIMPNFLDTLKNATGDFVAICDGDDYWTDPNKLQKQLSVFLENENIVLAGHNVEIFEEDIIHDASFPFKNRLTIDSNLIYRKNYIPALSIFYRNNFGVPDWMYQCSIGDYPLILHLSQFGEIHFDFEVMARYRLNSGYHSSISKQKRLQLQKDSIQTALRNLKLKKEERENLLYHYTMLVVQLKNGKWNKLKQIISAKGLNFTDRLKLIKSL